MSDTTRAGQTEPQTYEDQLEAAIKPCPKCGDKPVLEGTWNREIVCNGCGLWSGEDHGDLGEAIEWWNKQPRIDDLTAQLAAAQERVAALEAEAAYWNHHYNELMLEFHDAAPAVVREMRQQPTVPLDAPDSPGWWAWEEGNLKGVSEVYEGISKELIVSDEPGGLGAWYFSGRKWYRLTMPWDAQPKEGGSDAIKDND